MPVLAGIPCWRRLHRAGAGARRRSPWWSFASSRRLHGPAGQRRAGRPPTSWGWMPDAAPRTGRRLPSPDSPRQRAPRRDRGLPLRRGSLVLVPALTDACSAATPTRGSATAPRAARRPGQSSIGLDPFVSLRRRTLRHQQPGGVHPQALARQHARLPADRRAHVVFDRRPGARSSSPRTSHQRPSTGSPSPVSLSPTVAQSAKALTTDFTDAGSTPGSCPSRSTSPASRSAAAAGSSTRRPDDLRGEPRHLDQGPDLVRALARREDHRGRQLRAAPPTTAGHHRPTCSPHPAIPARRCRRWRVRSPAGHRLRPRGRDRRVPASTSPHSPTCASNTAPTRRLHLDQFLESRTGYRQQFAATMALMAETRSASRARVVVGFTAGTKNDDGTLTVHSRDAHAWPELYFSGIGWQRFEPTPPSAGGNIEQPVRGRGTAIPVPRSRRRRVPQPAPA